MGRLERRAEAVDFVSTVFSVSLVVAVSQAIRISLLVGDEQSCRDVVRETARATVPNLEIAGRASAHEAECRDYVVSSTLNPDDDERNPPADAAERPRPEDSQVDFLWQVAPAISHRLRSLYPGGKGGVGGCPDSRCSICSLPSATGKTTTSCSLAIQLASCRESILLIVNLPASPAIPCSC